jgi:ubiquinone/menaquinone biosynthesis C-methylase UbiE
MGFSVYGLDLSAVAVRVAQEWLSRVGHEHTKEQIVQADVSALPWSSEFFDHAYSDSSLDSMPFDVAEAGIAEIARVLKPDGYFYCSLISHEGSLVSDGADEVVIENGHEKGTVQGFFDEQKARRLLNPHFDTVSLYHVEHHTPASGYRSGRWHFIGRRK